MGFTSGAEPYTARNIWMSSGILHIWNPLQKQPATPWEAEEASLEPGYTPQWQPWPIPKPKDGLKVTFTPV